MMSPQTSNAKVPNAYAVEAAKVLELLAVDAEQGLSAESAEALLVEYGPNELTEARRCQHGGNFSGSSATWWF